MLGKHTTKDGRIIAIEHMDNQHLINTVAMLCRKIRETAEERHEGTAHTRQRKIIRAMWTSLQPYILHLYIRGFTQCKDNVFEAWLSIDRFNIEPEPQEQPSIEDSLSIY